MNAFVLAPKTGCGVGTNYFSDIQERGKLDELTCAQCLLVAASEEILWILGSFPWRTGAES